MVFWTLRLNVEESREKNLDQAIASRATDTELYQQPRSLAQTSHGDPGDLQRERYVEG